MKKLSLEYIREHFEKEGYTLLTVEYINAKTKLSYICSKEHRHSITWSNWNKGHRCPYCTQQIKPTIKDIKRMLFLEGYWLLSEKYYSNNAKLKCRCSRGHEYFTSWSIWNNGHRCPCCAGNARINIKEVKLSFEYENYILLSKDYLNSYTKLKYLCPKGHMHSISWASWKNGSRCPYCRGNVKLSIDFVRESFGKENYKLLSKKYINCDTKMYYMCPEGHVHTTTWDRWKGGSRCPTCAIAILSMRQLGYGNSNWQGGLSYEPYCTIWKDKEYKNDIKLRDGYKCLNPFCCKKDSRLHIHHIDYDKKNCFPNNLITLCGSCNAIANYDRFWHTSWYRAILYRRYSYEY